MKTILSLALSLVILSFWGCGPSAAGCSSWDFQTSGGPSIQITSTDSFIIENKAITFVLCFPKANYNNYYNHYTKTPGFPLLVNSEKMIFQVVKNAQILDSVIFEYKIIPKYMKKEVCKDERFVATVKVNRCETTGHYFHIKNYKGYDEE